MLSIDQLVPDFGDPYREASACRADCALFDFSFVYRARVSGVDAVFELEKFQPRKVGDMASGQIRYSVKTDRLQRVRSDLTLWRLGENCFDVMSGCRQDIDDLRNLEHTDFRLEDLSESTAIIAVQGPNALSRLADCMDVKRIRTLAYFNFTTAKIAGVDCSIGRLGYCGERGVEFLIDQSCKQAVWEQLCERIKPAGFAAIDILRIEAGFILFTNECRILSSCSEMGLADLLGLAPGNDGIRLTGFKAETGSTPLLWQSKHNRVARPRRGEIRITSACYSPYLKRNIGLGFVRADHASESAVDPDDEFSEINICPLPFYDPAKTIPRQVW